MLLIMNIETVIQQWRSLPPEEKLRRRWNAIPGDVARSMAFEREPVPQAMIQEILDQIEPPALLKRPAESSATPN
jgi:hypothetical protein